MNCQNPRLHGHITCGSGCTHQCKICEDGHACRFECVYCHRGLGEFRR